jgi:hypothetical protein
MKYGEGSLNTELTIARAALAYFAELPGQDASMTMEMTETMLDDIIVNGELGEMLGYVRRYCTVIDGPDQAKLVVLGITETLERPGSMHDRSNDPDYSERQSSQ